MFLDSRDAYQIVKGGVKHLRKRPEPFDQLVSQLIGVSLWDRVKEQKLQHVVRLEIIESLDEEPALYALSVVFVYLSLRYRLTLSPDGTSVRK